MLEDADKELLELIQSMSSSNLISKRDSNGIPYLKSVFYIYSKLFGEACSTCPSKISGYINKLQMFNLENLKVMSENKNFILNEGSLIVIPGTSEAYSNANLTDEVAIAFIADNPNRKSLFVKLPEYVDMQVAEYLQSAESTEEAETSTVEEVTTVENDTDKVQEEAPQSTETTQSAESTEEAETSTVEEVKSKRNKK